LAVFVVNLTSVSIKWNNHLNHMYERLQTETEIIQTQEDFFGYGQFTPWISLMIQKERGSIKNLFTTQQMFDPWAKFLDLPRDMRTLRSLERYGVVYCESLFEKIERFNAALLQDEKS